jgi:hypothetical protein
VKLLAGLVLLLVALVALTSGSVVLPRDSDGLVLLFALLVVFVAVDVTTDVIDRVKRWKGKK